MNTIAELLDWGVLQLATGDFAPYEAKVLLANTLKCDSSYLYANPNSVVSKANKESYLAFVARRRQNEPLSYIVGKKEFCTLSFKVSPDTLIPRTQTELLVKTILENLSGPIDILDLGTGCGAIGCTLAHVNSNWNVTGTDISAKAIRIAKSNADKLELKNIQFIESNWFEALHGRKFDAIVSNPPYLRSDDVNILFGKAPFEPQVALSMGPTGYEAFRVIINTCGEYLKPGGFLALEHGFDQAENLQALLSCRFKQITTVCDSAGNERVTFGYMT